MPSNGIQVAVTGEITPTAVTDVFPVTNPYWGLGGLRNVTDLVDRDAITINRREAGMLVFVGLNGHYYKLEAGLTNLDWTDLGTSLGGGTNPLETVNKVYLRNDAATQATMGGIAKNVYITTQTVYDAAVVVQIGLGGTNKVVIDVTVAATVGNLILIANHNPNVIWQGINLIASNIGTIDATNAAGNGFNVGSNLITQIVSIYALTVGAINTSATGATGNSGQIGLRLEGTQITSSNTSITNVLNTTGNGGNLAASINTSAHAVFGTITTSSQGALSNAGSIGLNAINAKMSITTLTCANGNNGGAITIQNAFIATLNHNNVNTGVGLGGQFRVSDCRFNNISITMPPSLINNPNVIMDRCIGVAGLTILNNGTGVTNAILNFSELVTYTSNASVSTSLKSSSLVKITNLGDNSRISNCSLDSSNSASASPVIDGIGTGCKIYNSTIIPFGLMLSIDNPTPVTVIGTNSVFENGVGANVTII